MEVERLEVAKLSNHIYIAESSSRKVSDFKRKRGYKYNQKSERFDHNKKKSNAKKRRRGRRASKKNNRFNMKCYNCSKLGHFTRECTESIKVRSNSTLLNYALVMSSELLTDSHPV